MDSSTTFVLNRPVPASPSTPSPHQTIEFSPLEFILGLIAVITIPALIYSLFVIKCPLNFFRSGRRRRPTSLSGTTVIVASSKDVFSTIEYKKSEHLKDVGGDCPVCLSGFADGEEVRQLSSCKHSFHVSCIDMWLYSHSNCPVCRAFVAVKRPTNKTMSSSAAASRNDDFQQGLPDSGSLV